jgi:hypothetical protein
MPNPSTTWAEDPAANPGTDFSVVSDLGLLGTGDPMEICTSPLSICLDPLVINTEIPTWTLNPAANPSVSWTEDP